MVSLMSCRMLCILQSVVKPACHAEDNVGDLGLRLSRDSVVRHRGYGPLDVAESCYSSYAVDHLESYENTFFTLFDKFLSPVRLFGLAIDGQPTAWRNPKLSPPFSAVA